MTWRDDIRTSRNLYIVRISASRRKLQIEEALVKVHVVSGRTYSNHCHPCNIRRGDNGKAIPIASSGGLLEDGALGRAAVVIEEVWRRKDLSGLATRTVVRASCLDGALPTSRPNLSIGQEERSRMVSSRVGSWCS